VKDGINNSLLSVWCLIDLKVHIQSSIWAVHSANEMVADPGFTSLWTYFGILGCERSAQGTPAKGVKAGMQILV